MSNGASADAALGECRAFVLTSVQHLTVHATDLSTFVEKFARILKTSSVLIRKHGHKIGGE